MLLMTFREVGVLESGDDVDGEGKDDDFASGDVSAGFLESLIARTRSIWFRPVLLLIGALEKGGISCTNGIVPTK